MSDQRPDRQEVEERVAIMEYDGGLPRAKAEEETAKRYGCATWRELMERTK